MLQPLEECGSLPNKLQKFLVTKKLLIRNRDWSTVDFLRPPNLSCKLEQLDSKLDELNKKPSEAVIKKDIGQPQSAMTKGRGCIPIEKIIL